MEMEYPIDRKAMLAILIFITGIIGGVVVYNYSSTEERDYGEYCQSIQESANSNVSINGTTYCYTPEQAKGNITVPEELKDRTDLACICINYFDGRKTISTINIAN